MADRITAQHGAPAGGGVLEGAQRKGDVVADPPDDDVLDHVGEGPVGRVAQLREREKPLGRVARRDDRRGIVGQMGFDVLVQPPLGGGGRIAVLQHLLDVGEVRGEAAHYVHSKVWAWIAVDRAARTAKVLRMSRHRTAGWERERELVADHIQIHGFSNELGSYVRAYGSTEMDSALLLLPLTGFDDDRTRLGATVDRIWKQLGAGGPLIYRYPPGQDGLPGKEGAFLPCSFWLLEALLRLGRIDEGLRLFEQVLASELLLLPEEIDPATGAYLGNYPMALSQAGLVHAVLEVQKVLHA